MHARLIHERRAAEKTVRPFEEHSGLSSGGGHRRDAQPIEPAANDGDVALGRRCIDG